MVAQGFCSAIQNFLLTRDFADVGFCPFGNLLIDQDFISLILSLSINDLT